MSTPTTPTMTTTTTTTSPQMTMTTTPTPSANAATAATLRPARDRAPLLLALLALVLILPAVHWGIPHATAFGRTHAWGNDDEVPLGPLAEMHNTFVVAKPDRNIAYPWFHYFAHACAGGPYLLYLLATGGLTNPSPEYPYGFADPVTSIKVLALMGRTISVVMGIAVVLGAYYTAKNLWSRTAGTIAALLTLLMFPLVYYARTGNPDVHVLGWTSLALAVFAACLRRGSTAKRGAWLGVCVAFAAATKDQAVGSFALLPIALLWLHFFGRRTPERDERASGWWPPVAALLAFAVVYILASGIPVDPARYQQHASKLLSVGTTRTLYLRHPATLDGTLAHARDLFGYLIDVMTWPGFIAAAAGVALAAVKDRRALPLLLASLGFTLILLPVGMSRVHYLLPVALPLWAFAAYPLARLIESGPAPRVAGMAIVIALCARPALVYADLTHAMLRDSRYAAGQWLDRHVQPQDRVLYFGYSSKLPPLRADVTGISVTDPEQALATVRRERPEYLIVMPQDINARRQRVEWRGGINSLINPLPADAYETLNENGDSEGYRLVAQFQTPRLIPWIDRPFLSYATVNPPIQLYARLDRAGDMPALTAWQTAPHYPKWWRVQELTVERVNAQGN